MGVAFVFSHSKKLQYGKKNSEELQHKTQQPVIKKENFLSRDYCIIRLWAVRI